MRVENVDIPNTSPHRSTATPSQWRRTAASDVMERLALVRLATLNRFMPDTSSGASATRTILAMHSFHPNDAPTAMLENHHALRAFDWGGRTLIFAGGREGKASQKQSRKASNLFAVRKIAQRG